MAGTRSAPGELNRGPVGSLESASRAAGERFRVLVDSLPGIVWSAAPDGSLSFVSDEWLRFTGEPRGVLPEHMLHPDDRQQSAAAWREAIRAEEPYENEARHRRRDGEYRWFLSRAVPVRDESGRVESWIGTMTDIHEHKRTESALHASEERFRLATEALAGYLYDSDLNTGRVQSFHGVREVLGFGPADAPPDLAWWQARVHPDDLARADQAWRAALAGDACDYVLEYRVRHEDGHYVDVVDRGRIVRDASGRAVRAVGGSTDISQRRRMEREYERLLVEVRWERARLAEIFETSPFFFALTRGPDHVYEFVNEAYYRMAGRRDLVGRRVYDVFPEGLKQMYPAARERVLRDGIPFVGTEVPLEIVPAGGGPPEMRFLDLTLLPLTEPDGTRSGIVLHGTDVTAHVHARRETERLLAESEAIARGEQDARAAAEQATRARDEVLRIISHELRAPLSVMKIAVDPLLNDPQPSPANVHHSADLLKRSAEWMERLLADLLDAASIETGRLALEREHETPRAILTHAAEMFDGVARQGGIGLETHTAPNLPVVFADRARVLQALSNLVRNALKATGAGGRVTLRAEREQGSVRFSVEDSGTGIAPENLPHMFDRSWQQQHHAHPGLGLGLAIVRGIVEAHGGQVGVESALRQGSRFSFTIPAPEAG